MGKQTPFLPGSILPLFFSPSSHTVARRIQSVHHILSLPVPLLQRKDSSLFPCSCMVSLKQLSTNFHINFSHEMQLFMNFFSVTSLPHVAVLQVQAVPACDLPGIMAPSRKHAPALVPVYIHMSIHVPAPAQASSYGLTCSSMGSSMGCRCISTMNLHGLQGHSLPHYGILHRLQGNLCCSTWSTSSPSFFTDFGACRAFFSHTPTLFSSCSCTGFFFHFLNI